VLRGEGAWRAAPDAPTQHETSFVLQVVRCDTKESEAALKEVAAAYAERFHQQAVLRTDSRTRIWW
jgi:hypothetical protein